MKRLEQLPQITEQGLAGLNATPGLKYRIMQEAQNARKPAKKALVIRAVCTAAAFALVLAVALPGVLSPQQAPLINSQPAGSATNAPALLSDNGISGGVLNANRSGKPIYHSIWEESGSNFPLIGIGGQYYRMLTTPLGVPSSLLGNAKGAIAEFTKEPALSSGNAALSNVCSSGTAVYPVIGMENTLVAAKVNGAMRLFQRVSFNGNATIGGEQLADTLQISGHATMIELSGVGTITDRATTERLVTTLLANATYESSASIKANQTLLIALDNGLTLQLAVKNDKLSACGTWSCPEFFSEFNAALR